MEVTIQLNPAHKQLELFGPADKHLRILRKSLQVQITARQSNLIISGKDKDVNHAAEVIDRMQKHLIKRGSLTVSDVDSIIAKHDASITAKTSKAITVYSHKKVIEPSTRGQLKYIVAMLTKDLTFCIGPAGTGKTYLAVAIAVSMLKKKQIRRIVLARPAVEAGEKLGFLPGDLQAKVNPYLRPLFDALGDMMDFTQMKKFMELDIIEIIPLAFMRGRTLNESVIICDEAQNTSPMQMLMMLTRLGHGSKMIITGDITQIDLEPGQKSGMIEAIEKLKRIKGIAAVELTQGDIVRHHLVQNIVRAYKRHKTERAAKFVCGLFTMGMYLILGDDTGATPDGRLSGEMLANSVSGSKYAPKIGLTSTHKSAAKLDTKRTPNGLTFNQILTRSLVSSERDLEKWVALLRTYFDLGGQTVQYSVLSIEDMIEAQKYPERYKDLIVRVGGYSAAFVDLTKEIQNDIIARSYG